MRYRIDPQGTLSAQELRRKVQTYLAEYQETEHSLLPPSGFLKKGVLKEQVQAERLARMTRIALPKPGTLVATTELEHVTPQPKSLVYSKQDNMHGWKITFYDLMTGETVSDVFLQVLTENTEAGFEVAENLAQALATDAGLIWDWLNSSEIQNHEPVVISVYEESSFSKLFPEAYKIILKDGQLTDRLPIAVGAARKKNGTLGVRVVVKDGLVDRDRDKTKGLVLQFALSGVIHLLSEIERADALEMSGKLVRSL